MILKNFVVDGALTGRAYDFCDGSPQSPHETWGASWALWVGKEGNTTERQLYRLCALMGISLQA